MTGYGVQWIVSSCHHIQKKPFSYLVLHSASSPDHLMCLPLGTITLLLPLDPQRLLSTSFPTQYRFLHPICHNPRGCRLGLRAIIPGQKTLQAWCTRLAWVDFHSQTCYGSSIMAGWHSRLKRNKEKRIWFRQSVDSHWPLAWRYKGLPERAMSKLEPFEYRMIIKMMTVAK